MVTSYPDVSCWAWAMAHAALISPMWLLAPEALSRCS